MNAPMLWPGVLTRLMACPPTCGAAAAVLVSEAYAKAHGIAVLIDGSAVPFVYTSDSIDVSRAFINEYNSKNPATALLAAPK